jgi:hypothetical protein
MQDANARNLQVHWETNTAIGGTARAHTCFISASLATSD